MDTKPKVIVVVGPTASGKSDFAVDLALSKSKGLAPYIDGEIISADSRQIYKCFDLGTGKITKEEMKGVPHYMIDTAEVGDVFSVAEYKKLATPILKDIFSRWKTPIICGGTGQYIDSLIFKQELPKVEPNIKLRNELEKKTTAELYKELKKKDSRRAENIDKNNRVRIIRALEIIDSLGKVPEQPLPKLKYETKIYLLNPSREILRERIQKRLIKRLEVGMLEEGEKISKLNLSDTQIKKLGLEYYSMNRYWKGEINIAEMMEEIITKSMQYAKRQQTWNKKYIQIAEIVEQ